jgi:hypothetical protein
MAHRYSLSMKAVPKQSLGKKMPFQAGAWEPEDKNGA